jgi:hypothetical protein
MLDLSHRRIKLTINTGRPRAAKKAPRVLGTWPNRNNFENKLAL